MLITFLQEEGVRFLVNKDMKVRAEAEEEEEQYWEVQQREPCARDTVAGKTGGVWMAS